jgi:hypothetical protein
LVDFLSQYMAVWIPFGLSAWLAAVLRAL